MLQKRNGNKILLNLFFRKKTSSIGLDNIKLPVNIRKTGTQKRENPSKILPIIHAQLSTLLYKKRIGAETCTIITAKVASALKLFIHCI